MIFYTMCLATQVEATESLSNLTPAAQCTEWMGLWIGRQVYLCAIKINLPCLLMYFHILIFLYFLFKSI